MTFRRTDFVRAAGVALALAAAGVAFAAVALPPKPARHLNDYARLLSPSDADRLDRKLVSLEQSSTVQLVVALFPSLPESAALEDFTNRTAESWGVGQKKTDNGAVLFVFVNDRKSRLEVGYGLEDKIPDIVAKRILDDVMAPHFKQGNFAAGLEAAIDAIVAAATGGPLPLAAPRPPPGTQLPPPMLLLIVVVVVIVVIVVANGSDGGGTYTGGGWSSGSSGWSGGGWSSSGGGWSSGGSSGGGFSGGGGSFGGGGASGSW